MCVRLKQPLRYNALAVRCKQGSQLHRKENQSTSVNLSQAGDQIEKWIARRAPGANLHCDQGAIRLSTCLEHDNGQCCSLAKCAANKDQITILAGRRSTTSRCVKDLSLEAAGAALMKGGETIWQQNVWLLQFISWDWFHTRWLKILLQWCCTKDVNPDKSMTPYVLQNI